MPLEPSTTPSHVLTVSQQNYGLTVEENNWDLTLAYAAISVAPNSITSSTTTNFTSGNVLFANSGFVGSLSRSGIDTRASFPNADVTAATSSPTAGTIVKRDGDGAVSFATSNTDGITLSVSSSGNPDSSVARTIQATATGTAGIAGDFTSTSGTAIIATSTTGTYHTRFGNAGNNQSAIERVRGWFVWFYSTFTGRLKTADITANRDWTLPNASGTIALTTDIVDSVTSATTSDGTANLSISNVTTATATVSSLLTANHIHGNIAGTLYTHVRTGEAVSKGDPVYVSGFHNGTGQAIVMRADASDVGKMPAIGVMDAAYAQNTSGANCAIAGTITSVDTDAFSVNNPVYVGDGGGFSETIGTIPQQVGIVERSNTNNGAFVVTNNKVISSADISNFTTAVQAIAPNAVTSATTSNGTASLDISNLTLSQAITSGLQTKMTFTANPTAVGDGQQIIWQWYNGGSPITTAAISSESTGSTSDKLIFKTSEGASIATSLDLTYALATFSGAIAATDSITIDGVEVAKVVDPVRTTLTGNGSTSVYAIDGASGLTNPSALIVAIDGVLQEPTVDYGVGSGNITFTSPLPNGSKAVVISPTNTIQVGQVTPSDGSVTSSKIASGVTLVSPTLVNTPVFNATAYTYGAGAAVAHRTALGLKTIFAVSDESKTPNNTNYIDDSELFLTLEAGTWRVQVNAFWSNADNTVGARAQVSFGGTMDITKSPIIAYSGSSTDSNSITMTSVNSRPVGALTSTMPRAILVAATGRNGIIQTDHTVSVSVAGIYRLQWGQGTASSTIAAIRKAGSFITATKLS